MKFWNSLHPKIKAVFVAGLVATAISLLNAEVDIYGDGWWTPIVTALGLFLAGYQKSAK